MIVNVIIPLGLNEPFSYNSPFELEIGNFVSVPFGNKTFIGVVVETNVAVKDGIKLKDVKDVLAIAPLQKELMDFMKWTSDYNLIPLGNVLKMAVNPVNFLRNRFDKKYRLNEYAKGYLFGDGSGIDEIGGGGLNEDDFGPNGCERSEQILSTNFDKPLTVGSMQPILSSADFLQTTNMECCQTNTVNSPQITTPVKPIQTLPVKHVQTSSCCEAHLHASSCCEVLLQTLPVNFLQTTGCEAPLHATHVKSFQTPPVKGGKGGSEQSEKQAQSSATSTQFNQNQEYKNTFSNQNGDLFFNDKIFIAKENGNDANEKITNGLNGDCLMECGGVGGEGNSFGTPLTPLHRVGLERLHRGGMETFYSCEADDICSGNIKGLQDISQEVSLSEVQQNSPNKLDKAAINKPHKPNLEKLKNLTKKQKLVVDYLRDRISDKENIFEDCNIGDAVLKNLVQSGIVEELQDEKKIIQNVDNITLNTLSLEQKQAFDKISKASNFDVFMLEGTTGSGKTEVYFHLIAKLLKESDRQALILLPEIALTSQLISRFKKQFNFEPAVWHSEITESKKSDIFKSVLSGDIRVVIGTRSALFLPFKSLGLMVVDEEHDASYKQSDNGCYNGRDLAIVRSKINDIPVILASATPSLETLINVDRGKYKRVYLPSRYGKAVLPDIKIVDMKGQKLKKDTYISDILRSELASNLANHKQSMLFMNRRGYAPVILCGNCGEKIQCPNCSCNLSYHKSKNRLICHHCEYFIEKPKVCPNCQSEDLIEFGPGVEKIEKEVKDIFPNARTIIMASDTTDTNKKLEETVAKILNNEVDIIIGTQLVAKGHHFPNLTLVGILDSDASLFGGDIRASERTYQLLTQISGRAGREEEKGRVYFQSYNSNNLILQAIKEGNKELLLDFEKQNRELGNFPPFGKMATIALASVNEAAAYRVAKAIARKFPVNDEIEVLGPAPALMSKLAKMFRFNIIVKTTRNINIQKLLKKVVLSEQYNSNVRIKIEIDG